MDMIAVWSLRPFSITGGLSTSSSSSGLCRVDVEGFNSDYPLLVRLRRGASEFVHRAVQGYDIGLVSSSVPRCMVAAIARSIDGGKGEIGLVRGSDDIGLGQDRSSVVPMDRGDVIVLSNDR